MYKVYHQSEALDFQCLPFDQTPTFGAVLFDEPMLDTAKMLQNLQNTKTYKIISQKQASMVDLSKCSVLWLVEAAGGVVRCGDRRLMIQRDGYWDLPKGMLEVDESVEECALREVCEECGVDVDGLRMGEFIIQTFHAYTSYGRNAIKRTWWYDMEAVEPSALTPQKEEGITAVEWLDGGQVAEALEHSFGSIRDVISTHNRMKNR